MKKQKTISLDEKTAEIAETIPNFSEWVRANLLRWDENHERKPTLKHWLTCDVDPSHVWMSYTYERYAHMDGRDCIACLKSHTFEDIRNGKQTGTLGFHSTIVGEDE